jgi:hypothetical protein
MTNKIKNYLFPGCGWVKMARRVLFLYFFVSFTMFQSLMAQNFTVEHIQDGGFERDPSVIKTCPNLGEGNNFIGFSGWFNALGGKVNSPDVLDKRCVADQTIRPTLNEIPTSRTIGNRVLGFLSESEPFGTNLINTSGLSVNTIQKNSFKLSFLYRIEDIPIKQYLLKTNVKIIFSDNLNGNNPIIKSFDIYPTTQWQSFIIILDGIDYTDEIKCETYSYSNNLTVKSNASMNGIGGVYLAFDDISLKGNCNNYLKYIETNLSSISSSSTITWTPTSQPNLSIGGDFIVDGNKTLNLTNFSGANSIKMGRDARLIVKDGSTLRINNSTLEAACNEMWQGIVVEPGGKLEMYNSKIYDAKEAIYGNGYGVRNTNARPLIVLDRVNGPKGIIYYNEFDRNHRHLNLNLVNANSIIRYNNFNHNQSLIDASLENSRKSIILKNSELTFDITNNNFNKGIIGFETEKVKATIKSNKFNNQKINGILSFGDKFNITNILKIDANVFDGIGRDLTNNKLLDENSASIRFLNGQDIQIINNKFRNQGAYGIACWVFETNIQRTVKVENNIFEAWQWSAISFDGIKNSIINIINNDFLGYDARIYNWGGVYPPTFTVLIDRCEGVTIQSNLLDEIYQGIFVANTIAPDIFKNTIRFNNEHSNLEGWKYKNGIYVAGLDNNYTNYRNAKIQQNIITSNPNYNNRNWNVFGIVLADASIDKSGNFPNQSGGFIQGNTLSNIGSGITLSGNNIGLTPYGTDNTNNGNVFNNLINGFNMNRTVLRTHCETIGSVQAINQAVYHPIFNSIENKWVYYDAFELPNIDPTVYNNFITHLTQNLWYQKLENATNEYNGVTNIRYFRTNGNTPILPSDFQNYSILLKSSGNTIKQICPNVQRLSGTDLAEWKRKYIEIKQNPNTPPATPQEEFIKNLLVLEKMMENRHWALAKNQLANLQPTQNHEENFKHLYALKIDKEIEEREFDVLELDFIENLAKQHNQEAGLAVHHARSYYREQTHKVITEPMYSSTIASSNRFGNNLETENNLLETEMNSDKKTDSFKIYPNPAQDIVTIDISIENVDFKIIDIHGKSVGSYKLNIGSNTLATDNIAKGIYQMIFYENENIIKTEKLVIIK